MTVMPPKEEKVDHAFYEELQNQLKESLNAKKAADKALSTVEDQIEKFEGIAPLCQSAVTILTHIVRYLTETSASGNVVKGFENYLRAQARPHRRVAEADIEPQRVFSQSSLTHLKVCFRIQAKYFNKQKVIPDNTTLDDPSPSPTTAGARKKSSTKRKTTSAAQSEDDSAIGDNTPSGPKRIRATMKAEAGS
jgi:hypothetical protein